MTATLIACSHGTSDPAGREAIIALIEKVRVLLPDVPVVDAFVDVQEPAVDTVVNDSVVDGSAVVVPLLLSTGYHTSVDIAQAVGAHPGRAVSTAALGPHALLADVLVDRLAEAGTLPGDAIVLAAAGSSDPAAAIAVTATAELLSARLHVPVTVGFAAGAGPRIADVVAEARRDGAERVVIASYVLAPGYFAHVIEAAGGDVVTRPLAPDARLAEIIAERYRAGADALPA